MWVRLPLMHTVRVCALALFSAQEALRLLLHQVWKDCRVSQGLDHLLRQAGRNPTPPRQPPTSCYKRRTNKATPNTALCCLVVAPHYASKYTANVYHKPLCAPPPQPSLAAPPQAAHL